MVIRISLHFSHRRIMVMFVCGRTEENGPAYVNLSNGQISDLSAPNTGPKPPATPYPLPNSTPTIVQYFLFEYPVHHPLSPSSPVHSQTRNAFIHVVTANDNFIVCSFVGFPSTRILPLRVLLLPFVPRLLA